MNDLRKRFLQQIITISETKVKPLVLVTAVQLPTGAIETAENREFIAEKLDYIFRAYDDEFCLKTNPAVRVVGFMLVVQP